MTNILVADDEAEIIELISLYLQSEEVNILRASDGEEALRIIKNHNITLGIIDIMMPKMNGFSVIESIRKEHQMPLIILSAREDYSDKIHGLQIGADDYMTKPFNALELKARVEAHLRRYKTQVKSTTSQVITFGKLQLDLDACEVTLDGHSVNLTAKEFKILALLSSKPGRIFTKQQIYETVWEESYYGDENTIRIHLSNLRDKIDCDQKSPKLIKTVRGLGYKIEKQV